MTSVSWINPSGEGLNRDGLSKFKGVKLEARSILFYCYCYETSKIAPYEMFALLVYSIPHAMKISRTGSLYYVEMISKIRLCQQSL